MKAISFLGMPAAMSLEGEGATALRRRVGRGFGVLIIHSVAQRRREAGRRDAWQLVSFVAGFDGCAQRIEDRTASSKVNLKVADSTYLPADAALKNLDEAGDNLLLVVAAEHRR